MPQWFGTLVSKGYATPIELDTVYGTQDVYDMLEIIAVDSHNQRLIDKVK